MIDKKKVYSSTCLSITPKLKIKILLTIMSQFILLQTTFNSKIKIILIKKAPKIIYCKIIAQ